MKYLGSLRVTVDPDARTFIIEQAAYSGMCNTILLVAGGRKQWS
jgi:hypothetical protein